MTFEEKSLKTRVIYKGRVFTVRQDEVTTANGTGIRDIIEHNGGVGIVALTPEKKLIMIRQFRIAAGEVVWEIPAGKLEDGEIGQTLLTAKRELKEETGWEAENWRHLTKFYGTIGYCTEMIDLYRADVTVKGDTHFDPSEAIDLYEMEIPELLKMVESGEIKDAKTIIAILMTARELGL
ncbi:MAG: NUDIX hydrolase [Firmicutes bacterium]|nr:NUDIX hydrolase [Bacillota bacterium]MBR6352144.1 NUDIX hydrolase [Bacillota bacterium]